MAQAHFHPLGRVRRSSIREAGSLVRNLDMAPLTGVSRDAVGLESRSRLAFFDGHQPTRRPWLALLSPPGRKPGLALLRCGRLERQESVVAGYARPLAV